MRGYTNLARACDELMVWLFAIIVCYIASAISLYSGTMAFSATLALIATCASVAWCAVAQFCLIFLGIDEPKRLTGSVVSPSSL